MYQLQKSRIFILCYILFLILSNSLLHATIPPKKGVKFPNTFYEQIRVNPKAFTYQRCYIQTVQKIQMNIQAVANGQMTTMAAASSGGLKVSGSKSIPVLTATYANTASNPYPVADLQKELFTGPWPSGTMKQFYEENSYGAFSVNGTVYDWTALANNDTYYEGSSSGLGSDSKVGEFIQEILDAQDATINFANYDNDGLDGIPNSGDDDGYVDFVAFVHPEEGGECGTSNIWSHRWAYSGWTGSAYTTNDAKAGGGNIKIDDYVIMPAFTCGGTSMIEIGVFCHEFGHAFGLPDLYDTDGSSEGVGHWGLMGAGNWNTPSSPAHMSAWSKIQLGWITPVNLVSNQNAKSIVDVETSPVVYKLSDRLPTGEYFLVENRQKIGFDGDLHEAGLLIWHIDENVINTKIGSNQVNNDENKYGVGLEQADGMRHLNNNNNRGDSGDPFPGSSNNHNFTNNTNPHSKSYNGSSNKVKVTNISNLQNPMIADLKVTPMLNLIEMIAAILGAAICIVWLLRRKGLLPARES